MRTDIIGGVVATVTLLGLTYYNYTYGISQVVLTMVLAALTGIAGFVTFVATGSAVSQNAKKEGK